MITTSSYIELMLHVTSKCFCNLKGHVTKNCIKTPVRKASTKQTKCFYPNGIILFCQLDYHINQYFYKFVAQRINIASISRRTWYIVHWYIITKGWSFEGLIYFHVVQTESVNGCATDSMQINAIRSTNILWSGVE